MESFIPSSSTDEEQIEYYTLLLYVLFYSLFIIEVIITVPQVIFFERRFLGVLQLRMGLFIYFLNAFFVFISDALKLLFKQ